MIVIGQMELNVDIGITMAYSIMTYVHQCTGYQNSGPYNDDTHCGTYIEVLAKHYIGGPLTGLYNKKQTEEVLIEVKLPPGLTSGYRSIPLPTQCQDFPMKNNLPWSISVWWVLRTPSEFIIEKRKNIYLKSPICDWDPFNERYRPYATIARVDDYGALGPNPAAISVILYQQMHKYNLENGGKNLTAQRRLQIIRALYYVMIKEKIVMMLR